LFPPHTNLLLQMDAGVKTSALAIVPDEAVWPVIQTLRRAHDQHVRVWPPHINVLYPFVPERQFSTAAAQLAKALGALKPMKLCFSQKGHFGKTAFLVPHCDDDPGLALLHATCVSVFPDMELARADFVPHLTIGQFKSEAECQAFLDGCPPLQVEVVIGSLCLLARDTMQHPFRTVSYVRLGVEIGNAVEPGSSQPYTYRAACQFAQQGDQPSSEEQSNVFQADASYVRLAFKVEAEALAAADSEKFAQCRHTLFVVDQSGSMGVGEAFEQVKSAVRYMSGEAQAGRHQIDFVLYNDKARRASAGDVLSSKPCSTTSFEEAFLQITDYIQEHPPGAVLNIVFMTDGVDTTSRDLPGAKRALHHFLETCERQTTFHAIGFTKSHQQAFLLEMCRMGTVEGMYRYAEQSGDSLESRFAEMFDFADVSTKTQLVVGGQEFSCVGEDIGDGQVRFDVVLTRAAFPCTCLDREQISVVVGGNEVALEVAKPDQMFTIRCVDEMEITTKEDLDAAQALLSEVQVQKARKASRKQVIDSKSEAQARLDKYHHVFAKGARSSLTTAGGNLTAELSSLRHEVTFSKARRARAMAQRATVNATAVPLMEQLLRALPTAPADELASIEAQQLCCTLSGDTAVDIMRDSQRDFFVFALRVCRPEDVIDAPTVLNLQQVLSGVYSNEAFQIAAQHALRNSGPLQAHGGFAGSAKNALALGDDVGLFRGPDGQMMNACLPLFLSDAHFARVRVQIKPILGYFFTLDPLGYKGDQILALFSILGKMLCIRAGTGASNINIDFTGSWADWLIEDFTKLCEGLRPVAMDYLANGGYTGVVRGDILQDFLASPAGRTKERIPCLDMLIGWAAVVVAELSQHFYMVFVEELWRRSFTAMYKGQSREPIKETLEWLLYGPGGEESSNSTGRDSTHVRNSASKDKEFALWAQYKRGDLSKKRAEEVQRKYGERGPQVEGLLSPDSEFIPRKVLRYEDAEDFFNKIMDEELARIHKYTTFAAQLYQGRPHGEGFTGSQKRLMLIQALRFVGNDHMNEAVANGRYLDTFGCLADEEHIGPGHAEAMICGQLHERYESVRQEKSTACVEKRNALLTAQRILASSDLNAFAGRCLVSCPTRGGEVFNCVVTLLAAGGKQAPHLCEKVKAILTGKIEEIAVISEGSSWVHCPLETAKQLQDAVGADEFGRIQLAMRGTWGHVYRASDIPNRHGHCISNPNTELTMSFSGFSLATDGC